MSAAIQTNRGGICGICFDEFIPGTLQFTHVGGENHDGFHRSCLASWLAINPSCPIDRQRINPANLISRKERIIQKLIPILVNTACATAIGFAAVKVEALVAGVGLGAAIAVWSAALAVSSRPGVRVETFGLEMALGGILVAGARAGAITTGGLGARLGVGRAIGSAIGALGGENLAARAISTALALVERLERVSRITAFVVKLGGAGAAATVLIAGTTGAVGAIGVAGAAGTTVGVVARQTLDYLGVNQMARNNIGLGLSTSALAAFASPRSSIALILGVGGVVSGIFSFI